MPAVPCTDPQRNPKIWDQVLLFALVCSLDMDKADLLREVFRTFVCVQSAKRLAALGALISRLPA